MKQIFSQNAITTHGIEINSLNLGAKTVDTDSVESGASPISKLVNLN